MTKKNSKNLQKVQDMLDGKGTGKIQSGYTPTEGHREVGDKWVDSDGNHWEQKKGYRTKNASDRVHHSWDEKCSDCESLIIKKWDKDSYKWNGRCYYCQIDYEAQFSRNLSGTNNQKDTAYGKYKEERFKGFKEDYIKKWEEDNKEFVAELEKLENPFDSKVANAIANGNVSMEIKKNKS